MIKAYLKGFLLGQIALLLIFCLLGVTVGFKPHSDPWWQFWSPQSGLWGSYIMGVLLGLLTLGFLRGMEIIIKRLKA